MQQKSKYAGVSGAKPQRASNYVRPGRYIVRLDRLEAGEAFKKGDYVAIQQTVLKTLPNGPVGFDYDRKIPLPPHSQGEQISEIAMVKNVAFEGRMKALLMVAGDMIEADFARGTPEAPIPGNLEAYPGQSVEQAVSPDQPLAGVVMEIRADTAVKKDAKAKPEQALTNADIYTRIAYLRRIPFAELPSTLDEATLARYFPDLQEQIASESQS